MLYCDAATFCRRRNDAGIMTDETGRRCAQESIDYNNEKQILLSIHYQNNFDHLLIFLPLLICLYQIIIVHLLWKTKH